MTFWACALILFVFDTAWQSSASLQTDSQGCLLPGEVERLAREVKLDARIKIYDEGNTRCEAMLVGYLQKGEFQRIPAHLNSWITFLEGSMKDIGESSSRKEKSKALIRFEIHLRKSIGTVQEAKLRAQVEQLEDFESWLTRAGKVHNSFVGMLFPK
jgi:hypothetical protein